MKYLLEKIAQQRYITKNQGEAREAERMQVFIDLAKEAAAKRVVRTLTADPDPIEGVLRDIDECYWDNT